MNLRPNPAGDWPQVNPTAYIDQTAQVIGKVKIDGLVKSPKNRVFVIPVKTGIQFFQLVKIKMDSRFRGNDTFYEFIKIGYGVFIGPNAVIRADETDNSGTVEPIIIGPECNIQDGVIIHALAGSQVSIGHSTSLAHGSIIHGPCILGANCFVGFRAVLYDTKVAKGVFIDHGTMVCHVDLPPHCLVPAGISIQTSEQVEKLAKTGPAAREFAKKIVATNKSLVIGYLAQDIKEKSNI